MNDDDLARIEEHVRIYREAYSKVGMAVPSIVKDTEALIDEVKKINHERKLVRKTEGEAHRGRR